MLEYGEDYEDWVLHKNLTATDDEQARSQFLERINHMKSVNYLVGTTFKLIKEITLTNVNTELLIQDTI